MPSAADNLEEVEEGEASLVRIAEAKPNFHS